MEIPFTCPCCALPLRFDLGQRLEGTISLLTGGNALLEERSRGDRGGGS
jgi:hypothetical protein